MPATAAQFGINPLDPESVLTVLLYLRHLMDNYDFTLREAIYAYNAGPGIQRYGVGTKKIKIITGISKSCKVWL